MNVYTQLEIRKDPNVYRYLREHSYWYKYLNRNPMALKELTQEMKKTYKLTAKDRIDNISKSMEMVYSLFNAFK